MSSTLHDTYGSITFTLESGTQLQATPVHFSRHQIVFEVVAPELALRTSEVLADFTVRFNENYSFTSRATITGVTQSETRATCVASIENGALAGLEQSPWRFEPGGATAAFRQFMTNWQKYYYVQPEFKVLLTDMQTFLTDLRFWCEMVEGEAQSHLHTSDSWEARQLDIAHELGPTTTPAINEFFERFESLAAQTDEYARPAYRILARRMLHPLLLGAPFLYRTYRKPLGYAGDYEMVNMISRSPFEGTSLYSKLVNLWFLQQPPAEAHRNRLIYLQQRIDEAAVQALTDGRPARIYNLGCGPAIELQDYIRKKTHPGQIEFMLVDFNEETLEYAKTRLEAIQRSSPGSVKFTFVKKSVNQVLKEASRLANEPTAESQYDFVYCAGLYDYLTDAVCRRLSTQLYQLVRPGGLLVTTNVDESNPWPLVMDFVMDWHLIYRTGKSLLSTKPENADVEQCRITSDYSGVNIFSETRKPDVRPA